MEDTMEITSIVPSTGVMDQRHGAEYQGAVFTLGDQCPICSGGTLTRLVPSVDPVEGAGYDLRCAGGVIHSQAQGSWGCMLSLRVHRPLSP